MELEDIINTVVETFGGDIEAWELIYYTGLAESEYKATRQYGGGPALSYWQIEPATEEDIWKNYISYRPHLKAKLAELVSDGEYDLETNQLYACAMCRIHYMRVPDALPTAGDREGQARYWKQFYNTELGAGTVEHFLELANKYS